MIGVRSHSRCSRSSRTSRSRTALQVSISLPKQTCIRTLPVRRDPRRFPPQGYLAVVSRKSSLRGLTTLHQEHWKQSFQSHFDQPLLIHTPSISPHAKEEKDQKATSKVDPSIVKDSGRHDHRCIPSFWIVQFAKVERVVLARVLGDDDVDLDGCYAEDEDGGGGEEAEEAAACCIAAGENAVEGRAVFVEAIDDEGCQRRHG